ncbi:MAG: FkbM family methyltransferase, partial [bacterium]
LPHRQWRRPPMSSNGGRNVAVPGRVSVIVPTRNSGTTIERCLTSVRAQSDGDVELIVVDNNSTDATAEVAARLADQVIEAGPERSRQRNIGARVSSGEFLMFIDSDMILSPLVALEAVQAFAADPDVQALVIPERSIGQGFWARCRSLEKVLYIGDPTVEAARIFRRTAFLEVEGYDERIHGGGEEWDLPERIVLAGRLIGRVEAGCLHDEGRLSLIGSMQKKFYYGRTFGRYATKRPRAALAKVLRTTFFKRARHLVTDPVPAGGLALMKASEGLSVAAGMLVSSVVRHPADTMEASTGETKGRRGLAADTLATQAAFRNWIQVGVLAGLALPSRLPPRSGWRRIANRRLAFRTRLGPVVETELGNGTAIVEIFRDGEYEAPFDWSSFRLIVDVGAHVGSFALWVAERCPKARVMAFEPEPRNYRDLVRNVARNRLGDRVFPRQEAVTGRIEQRTLRVPADRGTSSLTEGAPGETIIVDCIDFDRFLLSDCATGVDLLKMDCEGAEWEILPSLSQAAWARINHLLLECHSLDSHDLSSLQQIIADNGLRRQWINKANGTPASGTLTIRAQRR